MRKPVLVLAGFLTVVVAASALADGMPGPCDGSFLTKKAFLALPDDQKKQELKRLSVALKMGCRSATQGLSYLLAAAPHSKAEAYSWYRLLVETAGTQATQIQLQESLLDQFLARIDEQTQDMKQLQQQQTELLQKAASLMAERNDARLRADRLSAKISALNSRLKTVGRLEAAKAAELRAMKKRLDATASSYAQSSGKVAALEKRLKAARQEMAELQKRHEGALANARKLQVRIDKLKSNLSARSDEVTAAQAKIAGLESDISTLQNNMAGLVDDLDQRKKKITALEGQLEAQQDALRKARNKAAAQEKDYKAQLARAAQREGKLSEEKAALESKLQAVRADKRQADARIDTLAKAVDELDAKRADLEQRLAEQRQTITGLEAENGRLQGLLDKSQTALAAERDRNNALTNKVQDLDAALADSRAKAADAEAGIRKLADQVAGLELDRSALAEQVNRLTGENASHRDDLQNKARVIRLLERDIEEKRARIATLEERARQPKPAANPLAPFNDQFLKGLEKAFQGREGFSSDGKRFFVQAEILFKSGSAELGDGARRQLRRIAEFTLRTTSGIPSDLKWVLRVNGHTDIRKMRPGSRFADNWELSSQRALAVVRLFVKYGVPADHLAAVGYGAFHPVAKGKTAADFKRNRRIELRLVPQD